MQYKEIRIRDRWRGNPTVEEQDGLSSSAESTARGIPSLPTMQERGSWDPPLPPLIMIVRRTAETVGAYAVLFLARSHVRPINSQSLSCIFFFLSGSVPFVAPLPPLSCHRIQQKRERTYYTSQFNEVHEFIAFYDLIFKSSQALQ